MDKAEVQSIMIAEKIFIEKSGVKNFEQLSKLYTYIGNDGTVLTTLKEEEDYYTVPSNSYHKLSWKYIVDCRMYEDSNIPMNFSGKLRWEQQEVVDKFFSKGRARSGIIQAPCGWGKTYTGCNIIARNKVKTLVMVHTKLLFRQWIDELTKQIPDAKIGKIGDGILEVEDVTVGIYKSVYNNIETLRNKFSMVIVDEAHLCPAELFSTALNSLNAKIKIGITATPKRKDGKHIFLTDYFSPFLIKARDPNKAIDPSVKIIQTDLKFSVFDPKRDWSKQISKLAEDDAYLRLIAEETIKAIKNNRCPLILGERVGMLEKLQTMIPDSICVIGKTTEEERKDALENVGSKYKCVLSTKLFDEGISCHRLDTLILSCPSNNPVKLEQRVGRIIREHDEKEKPLVIDFWLKGKFVERQQKIRYDWYKARGYYIL